MRITARCTTRKTDRIEQLVHALMHGSTGAQLMRADWFGDDALYVLARVQTRVRILKDHLHMAASLAQFFVLQRREFEIVEGDRAGRKRHEPKDGFAHSALAATALANQPQRGAARDREIDSINGAYGTDGPVENESLLDGEVHVQIAYLKHQRPLHTGMPTGAGCTQRSVPPSREMTSSGA